MKSKGLKWFCWDAMVDVILPASLTKKWEGSDPPSGGRVVTAKVRVSDTDVATDYDRACSVEEPVALIRVGDGQGIVISNAPLLTWVPQAGNRGGFLVVALAWDELTDDVALNLVAETTPDAFGEPSFLFETKDDRLFVMAAADLFENEYGYGNMPIDLEPGTYQISTAEQEPGGVAEFLIHRFEKV